YVVRWRKLTANPQGRQQIMDIVGNGAQMYLGNASGNLWTDLVKVAPNPPATVDALAKGIEYQRDGQLMMALSRPIPETPWFVLIEFATGPLLTPANKFLRRTIVISIVLLIVGVAASIVVSRIITRPLSSITSAASAISAGDYSQS